MRVALVTSTQEAHRDGEGPHLSELERGVMRAGGEVRAFYYGAELLSDAASPNGDAQRPIKGCEDALSGAYPRLAARLRRQAERFDLVHIHGRPGLAVALTASGIFRRVVFSPHMHQRDSAARWLLSARRRRWSNRATLAASDLVVCSSHAEATTILGDIRASARAAPVSIVPPGIDTVAIADARAYPTSRRVVLSIGGRDGAWRNRRAISALVGLGSRYELAIAGANGARRSLEARAADMGVAERVRFLPPLSDTMRYCWLRTAAVALALDRRTNGRMLMEALYAGAPVVAADTPANREAARLFGGGSIHLVDDRSSPLAIGDEVARAAERRVGPLAASAVPSLADTADRTVSLYAELLRGGLEHPRFERAGSRAASHNGAHADAPGGLR